MKFIFLGIALGFVIGVLPFWMHRGGILIHPEWHGNLEALERIEPSADPVLAGELLPSITYLDGIYRMSAAGVLKNSFVSRDKLNTAAGGGGFFAEYEKVGRFVEFFNIKGDRFWKIKSMEYPRLSYNGKITLLFNGDQSKVRVVDFNGIETGVKSVSGRFCVTHGFSRGSDHSALGFLDGRYYLLDDAGELKLQGRTPDNLPVKSLALSPGGNYLAVHYGGEKGDFIRLCKAGRDDFETLNLKNIHHTRIPLLVEDDGRIALIDRDRFLIADDDCDIRLAMPIPAQRPGHASIDYRKGIFAVGYGREKGGAQFFLMRDSGEILYSRSIEEEPFLDCRIGERFILLRGSQSLYCYSYLDPAVQ